MKTIVLMAIMALFSSFSHAQSKPTRAEAESWLTKKIIAYLDGADAPKERESVSMLNYISENKLIFFWKKKDAEESLPSENFTAYFKYTCEINIDDITSISIDGNDLKFNVRPRGIYVLRKNIYNKGIYDLAWPSVTFKLNSDWIEPNLAERMMKCINDLKTNTVEKY